MEQGRQGRLAVVYSTLPTAWEVEQLKLFQPDFNLTVISFESIVKHLSQIVAQQEIKYLGVPEYQDQGSFLPGLEQLLKDFDTVVVKDRIGFHAYQAVKAKWKHKFRLLFWCDNLNAFPGEDIQQMRAIRVEANQASDGFIVQTDQAKATLLAEGISSDKIAKLPIYVETFTLGTLEAKKIARKKLGLEEDALVISYVGIIEWHNCLKDLLLAVHSLQSQKSSPFHKVMVVFCGLGNEVGALSRLALQLKIDQHVCILPQTLEHIQNLFAATDAAYFASIPTQDRTDGDPYFLHAAMANSLPVITHRSPLVEETVEKHRFDMVPGCYSSVAKALNKFVSAKQLVTDIVQKNRSKLTQTGDEIREKMIASISLLATVVPDLTENKIDLLIREVEQKVAGQQFLAAIDLIEPVIDLELPKHHKANLYRLIGDCFTKLGEGASGKEAYIKALEWDSVCYKSYIGLGTISLTQAQFDIAVIHFRKAVSLAPKDAMACLGMGLAFQGIEEWKEAVKWVGATLDYEADNTAALYTLVKISQEMEEYDEVIQRLESYLYLHPTDNSITYTLGGIYYHLERYEDCLNLMQNIILTDPLNSQAQSLVRQARKAMGKEKMGVKKGA